MIDDNTPFQASPRVENALIGQLVEETARGMPIGDPVTATDADDDEEVSYRLTDDD